MIVTIAQMKSDIAGKMKGTSIREVKDFYGTVRSAANRMLARIDPEETRRTATMTTPFFDCLDEYAIPSDYKRALDIRPQANRTQLPGRSHFRGTSPRQFGERLDPNSFALKWNNGVRTMQAKALPTGNVVQMDSFDSATANGSWAAFGDASGLYTEVLNYVEGSGALGFNISGSTGASYIENSTAAVADLSALLYEDSSFMMVWIPIGQSVISGVPQFTSFKLRRGSSASAYREASATVRADGTAFQDGWNLLKFDWYSASVTGSPDNTKNTYRRLTVNTVIGTVISGFLVDNWTNSLGTLYEMDYYSEYMFRSAAGTWKPIPTLDTDLVNVGPNSYEILLAEMMIDVTMQIRTGAVRATELADWRLMLNGQPQSRYVKDPPFHGLYADYTKQFPSSAIVTTTSTYTYDV